MYLSLEQFWTCQLYLEHDLIKNTTSYSLQLDMYVSLEHVWIGSTVFATCLDAKECFNVVSFQHVFEFGTILDRVNYIWNMI